MIFVTALDHPQLFIRYFMTRVAVSMLGWKKLGLEQRLGGRIVTYAGDLDAETGHAASARRTRFAISGPRSRSIRGVSSARQARIGHGFQNIGQA
jgi:hypothetical protein